MTCYVPYCDSIVVYKRPKRKSDISFHQFPTDPELRKKWIFAIGKKDPKTGAYWDPFASSMVCSLHFSPKQFKYAAAKRILKNGSIPFIFPDYYLPQRGALIQEADLSSMKIISTSENVEQHVSKQSISASSKSPNTQISLVGYINNKNAKKKRTFSEINSSQIENNEILDKSQNFCKPRIRRKVILVKKIQKLETSETDKKDNFIPNVDLAAENCSSALKITPNSSLNINVAASPIQNNLDLNTDSTDLTKNTNSIHLSKQVETIQQCGALTQQADLSSIKIISAKGNVVEDASKQSSPASSQSSNTQISFVDNTYSDINNNKNVHKKRTFSKISSSQIENIEVLDKPQNSYKPTFLRKGILVKKIQKCETSKTDKVSFISNVNLVAKNSSSTLKMTPNSSLTNFTTSAIQNNLDSNTDSTALTENTNSIHHSKPDETIKNRLNAFSKLNGYLLNKLNTEISKTCRLEGKLSEMQEENESLKSSNKIMEDVMEIFNLGELKKGIISSNAKALFLFDQLRNFAKKEHTWYESTKEFANNLEDKLPECYNFLRQANILTLPPSKNVKL